MVGADMYFMIMLMLCNVGSNGTLISGKPKETLPTINLANSSVTQLYITTFGDPFSIQTTLKDLNISKDTEMKTEAKMKLIQDFYNYLLQIRLMNSRAQDSCGICRQLKNNLTKEYLDCNTTIERNKQLQRSTKGMKRKIKELEKEAAVFRGKISSNEIRIINLEARFHSRNASNSDHQKTVVAKDKTIADLQKSVVLKDSTVADLRKSVIGKDAIIQKQKAKIADLQRILKKHGIVRNLAIVFDPKKFKLRCPHQVLWKSYNNRIVHVNELGLSDTSTVLEIRDSLESVFVDVGKIRKILQWSGYSNEGKKTVRVTSSDGGMASIVRKQSFCDTDGIRYEGSELKKKTFHYFSENDKKRFPIRYGDCRTVLHILDK